MTPDKPRRLGRGLEALLATRPAAAPVTTPDQGTAVGADGQPPFRSIPIAQIRPNPYQPRKEFKPEELADLEAGL